MMDKFIAKVEVKDRGGFVFCPSLIRTATLSSLGETPDLVYQVEGPYPGKVRPYKCCRRDGNTIKEFWVHERDLVFFGQLELFEHD